MFSSSTNDLLLDTLSESGSPPKTRIKDAKSAREIYHKLLKADEESARNRAAIDEMFAGAPPYDDAELRATGQAARANVNFGEADALLESALAGSRRSSISRPGSAIRRSVSNTSRS